MRMFHFDKSVSKEIEHTADVGIQASGCNEEELFANLAFGMLHLMVEYIEPLTDKILTIRLEEPSVEDLIVSWLSEINYQFQVRSFIPYFIEKLIIREKKNAHFLEARLSGPDKINTSQSVKMEIKAVTYHQLFYRETDDGLTAQVIFDI
jgi:SHS2 domain-containing protein